MSMFWHNSLTHLTMIIFLIKTLKTKKKKLAGTGYISLSWLWNTNRWFLKTFAKTNQDCTIFYTSKNSKILNIISKYFSIFSNTLPATWVVHITRNFLIFYSCLYYSTMTKLSSKKSCALNSNAVNIHFEITFLFFEGMWNFSALDFISIKWNLASVFF